MKITYSLLTAVIIAFLSCAPKEEKKTVQQESPNPKDNYYSAENKSATILTTAENSENRLTKTDELDFVLGSQPKETEICVFVNPAKTFQDFVGIGGAISDASAEIYATLSDSTKAQLIDAYYDNDKGIGYTMLRTSIHSTDFSSESYTYIQEGDSSLTSFSIDHDRAYRIPLIKAALEKASSLVTHVAPWSPPAFMKSNQSMLKGGSLLPEYYQSWANYYVKFIKAYEAEGIPIWGLTVQNEPMATQTWESCIYTADEERDFVKNYLGPTLASNGLGDKKLMVWDHNRDLINQRAATVLSDPDASKYVWGVGFHWYETWAGGEPMFENVGKVKEAFPEKHLLFTEGCNERFDATKYQFWPNAERYGKSMINDFNNGTEGWTDWNILLDQNGGPNHVGNFCFAPIHADTATGELIYTPSYYYIGHFSKFIKPNAKRIGSAVSRSVIISTTFQNENGGMATVVLNSTDEEVSYNLFVEQFKIALTIPAHGIQTIVY